MENIQTPITPVQGTEQVTEPVVNTEQATETGTEQSNPMRELRNQYNQVAEELKTYKAKMSELTNRVSKRLGLEPDKLDSDLDNYEITEKAKSNGITPELQRQLLEQQNELDRLKRQNFISDFERRKAKLITDHPEINDNDIVKMAQAAEGMGTNIYNPGLDLVSLYRATNFDKVKTDMETAIREKVIQELQHQGTAPNVRTIPGTTNAGSNASTLMDDPAKLINELLFTKH